MTKQTKKQANFRLPEQLLADLRLVTQDGRESQSEIVRDAIEKKVERLKTKIAKREAATV